MPQKPDTSNPADKKSWMTAGIAGVGLSSFFSDSGHEIITSVLPSFVTSILHALASALGLIEGISDAIMGLTKLAGGPLANNQKLRGKLASGGYAGTAIASAAIGLAAAVWQAGILRGVAWIARGLRSPSRDTILASLASQQHYGKAFGIERAGDNLGAVVGPLLAAGLIRWVGIPPCYVFRNYSPGCWPLLLSRLQRGRCTIWLPRPSAKSSWNWAGSKRLDFLSRCCPLPFLN
jgi:hypothetical protein